MICKICNAEIDDNSTVCPFCGAAIEGVDSTASVSETPAFPDPAASAPAEEPAPTFTDPVVNSPVEEPVSSFEDPAASAPSDNTSADLGLSEPAQPFADPAAQNPAYNSAAAQNQGFTNPDPGFNAAPQNQGFTNPDPGFNSAPQNNGYGVPPQPNYGQPTTPPPMGGNYGGYTNMADPSADLEKQAGTVQTLGIVGLIVSIVVGFCCCALPGPIVGIVGLVKFNKIKDSLYMLTEAGQKKANTGKILCIVAIVLGALAIISNIVLMSTGALSNMMEELQ